MDKRTMDQAPGCPGAAAGTGKDAGQKVVTYTAVHDILGGEVVRIPLLCARDGCHLPFGFIVLSPKGSYIEIEALHHGMKHKSVIPLASISAIVGPDKAEESA